MKWCSVCQANYRGHYSVHAGTVKHRRLARGPADSRIRRLKPRKSYRAPKAWTGTDEVRVRKHRRRRPDDGPARVVKVKRYWRSRAQRWTHIPATLAEIAGRYVR